MALRVVVSRSAAARLSEASRWLAQHDAARELLVVGSTLDAARSLVARATRARGATFGWGIATLARYAAAVAGPELATQGRVAAGQLVLEALCARIVHDLAQRGGLGRFQPIGDRPGLVRAIARTVHELRLAGLDSAALRARDPDVANILSDYEQALVDGGLADRAAVLATALARVRSGEAPVPGPLLLLDVPIGSALEAELVVALARRAPDALAVVPTADARTVDRLRPLAHVAVDELPPQGEGSLARLQSRLFDPREAALADLDDGVAVLSAPGESRECVEIARRILRAAEAGTPFDRMAVLLRAPSAHRPHLEEAFRRARIPAHFAQGSTRPDPAGRAFLALLSCAAEGLRARRFAEYLSLGQVPDRTDDGAPPAAAPSEARWIRSDDDLLPPAIASTETPAPPGDDASLPAPRRWEQLLVDAAVIGGRERWARRLDGLRRELELDLRNLDDAEGEASARGRSLARSLADLDALRAFALPLLDELVALPALAQWGAWLDALASIATRALRRPERVLAVLAELAPMAPVGPVNLHEVRLVLGPRLRDLVVLPEASRDGRVFVAPIDFARGLSFDLVFVPGLAEKVFPQKVVEDPVLRDAARAALDIPLDVPLDTNDDRVAAERLALHLAVGAAEKQLVLSWSRLDVEQGRPRVPSFYGLEVLRAAEGALSGYDELTRRAERAGNDGSGPSVAATRLGWPAPASPRDAIDEAEHDLALLATLLHGASASKGTARYLLDANPHLARALRFRARRWIRKWTSADGLVDPGAEAKAALARHAMGSRSFSPTALQHYAACPYRFLLQAVHRLAPREAPEGIEELDPLQRGSLVHEVLYELLVALREEGRLPLHEADFEPARDLLDRVVDRVAGRFRDELAPAIDRVWDDGIASVRADVREWLARACREPEWVPWKFELSFGLRDRRAQDPSSRLEPVTLAGGLQLRGSIDLVERRADGALRATDYKTGKARAKRDAVVGGGETLQPVLYALALEQFFPGTAVAGGRLYYCTSAGEYAEVTIPLDDYARRAAGEVIGIVGEAIAGGFLPAAPADGACEYCDYRVVCGPHEEQRTRTKAKERLVRLRTLRGMP